MVWDKPKIMAALKKLRKQGADLSYNARARQQQSLVSAAAYHFGSYRAAVEKAGVDYADVARRPRWTKAGIIRLIKEARKADEELHWSAITKRRDELGKAAFASLQPRLFGSWDRALHAAGVDADEVNRYRKWTRDTVVSELKARSREAEPLNSGAVQRDDPGLHAAAVRHFAGYDPLPSGIVFNETLTCAPPARSRCCRPSWSRRQRSRSSRTPCGRWPSSASCCRGANSWPPASAPATATPACR